MHGTVNVNACSDLVYPLDSLPIQNSSTKLYENQVVWMRLVKIKVLPLLKAQVLNQLHLFYDYTINKLFVLQKNWLTPIIAWKKTKAPFFWTFLKSRKDTRKKFNGEGRRKFFLHSVFHLFQSQRRLARVSNGSDEMFFESILFNVFELKTPPRSLHGCALVFYSTTCVNVSSFFYHTSGRSQIWPARTRKRDGIYIIQRQQFWLFSHCYKDMFKQPNRRIFLTFLLKTTSF